MIVVLCRQFHTGGASDGFAPTPDMDMAGSSYLQQLSKEYRRLGADDICWIDSDAPLEPAHVVGNALRPITPEVFTKISGNILIAHAQMWPTEDFFRAIRRNRSGRHLFSIYHNADNSSYAETVESDTASNNCTVVRNYDTTCCGIDTLAAVAINTRKSPQLWQGLAEMLAGGAQLSPQLIEEAEHCYTANSIIYVDSLDKYLQVAAGILSRPEPPTEGAQQIGKGAWAMPSAMIGPDCTLSGPLFIGENTRIERRCRLCGPTLIGDGVTIDHDSFIGSSIILPGAAISSDCRIWRSQIEQGTNLSEGRIVTHERLSDDDASSAHYDRTRRFTSVVVPSGTHTNSCNNLRVFAAVKRLLDIVGALVGLAITLPFYPFFALAIKLESRGGVFYIDRRLSRNNREFGLIKFRSMVQNAHQMQSTLAAINEVDGPQFHIDHDPRITRIGRFMRATKIDELPQFWNVLFGHMSLVGPRPLANKENQYCPAWRESRLSVRPGLTGLWQVMGANDRNNGDFHQWIQYDDQYVREHSLKTDIKVLWLTLWQLCRKFVSMFTRCIVKSVTRA